MCDIKSELVEDNAEELTMPEFVQVGFEDCETDELGENILITEEPVCDASHKNYNELKSEPADFFFEKVRTEVDATVKEEEIDIEEMYMSEVKFEPGTSQHYGNLPFPVEVIKAEKGDTDEQENITNTTRYFEENVGNAVMSGSLHIGGSCNHHIGHSNSKRDKESRNNRASKEDMFETTSGHRSKIQPVVLEKSTKFYPVREGLGNETSLTNSDNKQIAAGIESKEEAEQICCLQEKEGSRNSFSLENVAHRVIKTKEDLNKCTQCEKSFSTRKRFVIHMRTHTGERRYKCSQCDKAFFQNQRLKFHMRIHTGEKPFKCSQCDKAFSQRSNLVCHMKIHTGVKPYKCSQCDKAFSQRSNLVCHMKIHTGERPFKCSQCDKAFIQNSDLTKHVRTHTGKKTYKCSQCDKAFFQSSHLTIHMKIHTGERRYKCSQCDKAFYQSSHLLSHMRIHTGLRPFKCNQCNKVFTQNSHLTFHMQSHTGERPFKCR